MIEVRTVRRNDVFSTTPSDSSCPIEEESDIDWAWACCEFSFVVLFIVRTIIAEKCYDSQTHAQPNQFLLYNYTTRSNRFPQVCKTSTPISGKSACASQRYLQNGHLYETSSGKNTEYSGDCKTSIILDGSRL